MGTEVLGICLGTAISDRNAHLVEVYDGPNAMAVQVIHQLSNHLSIGALKSEPFRQCPRGLFGSSSSGAHLDDLGAFSGSSP